MRNFSNKVELRRWARVKPVRLFCHESLGEFETSMNLYNVPGRRFARNTFLSHAEPVYMYTLLVLWMAAVELFSHEAAGKGRAEATGSFLLGRTRMRENMPNHHVRVHEMASYNSFIPSHCFYIKINLNTLRYGYVT